MAGDVGLGEGDAALEGTVFDVAVGDLGVDDDEGRGGDGVDGVDGDIHDGVQGACPCRRAQGECSKVAPHLHVVIVMIVSV